MKKVIFVATLLIISNFIFSQNNLVFNFTNNGIAQITEFSLNQPAASVFCDIQLGKHFAFQPDLAFSLETGNLWYADLWFIFQTKAELEQKWNFFMGIDIPAYIDVIKNISPKKNIHTSVPYKMGKVGLERYFGDDQLAFEVWLFEPMNTSEKEIAGNYLSIYYKYNKEFDKFSIAVVPNLFHINCDGTVGFYFADEIRFQHNQSGLFISRMEVIPFDSGIRKTISLSLGIKRYF